MDTFSETEIEEIPVSLSSPGPSNSEASVIVDVPNLFSKLKCPAPSDLSRKRKLSLIHQRIIKQFW